MASSDDAPIQERRADYPVRPIGRRWKENPVLADVVSRVLLSISRNVYGMRECREWSQEDLGQAAGMHADSVMHIEQAEDHLISTLARVSFAAGFEVEIRFRPLRRLPDSSRVNLSVPTTSS
ncbi:MAG TPA: hypothetical protein VM756_05410 [Burkholderiales bacterium]|nr:hypothetical protein [Burkholderiales bacterium]